MAAKRSKRPAWHRRLANLLRIRISPKREAAARREALKVFGVIAVAAIIGFAVARLWLPATSRQEARLAEIAPAAGSPESAHARVDLSSAKWNLPPETHKSDSSPPSTVQPSPSPASAAWMRFASAAPETNGRPMVAIVIDDVGVDRHRSARAIELPATVTLAFLPYAEDVADQVRIAKQSGHELLVHMPMEAMDSTQDPGPNALLTEIPDDELLRRLRWNLDRFDGYVGVNNHGRDLHAHAALERRTTAVFCPLAVEVIELELEGRALGLDLQRATRAFDELVDGRHVRNVAKI